jgi:hypothetical protein
LFCGNTKQTHQHHSHDQRYPMIWRVSFVVLLFASILTACQNRIEEKPCPITKNKSLSASRVTAETRPAEALSC